MKTPLRFVDIASLMDHNPMSTSMEDYENNYTADISSQMQVPHRLFHHEDNNDIGSPSSTRMHHDQDSWNNQMNAASMRVPDRLLINEISAQRPEPSMDDVRPSSSFDGLTSRQRHNSSHSASTPNLNFIAQNSANNLRKTQNKQNAIVEGFSYYADTLSLPISTKQSSPIPPSPSPSFIDDFSISSSTSLSNTTLRSDYNNSARINTDLDVDSDVDIDDDIDYTDSCTSSQRSSLTSVLLRPPPPCPLPAPAVLNDSTTDLLKHHPPISKSSSQEFSHSSPALRTTDDNLICTISKSNSTLFDVNSFSQSTDSTSPTDTPLTYYSGQQSYPFPLSIPASDSYRLTTTSSISEFAHPTSPRPLLRSAPCSSIDCQDVVSTSPLDAYPHADDLERTRQQVARLVRHVRHLEQENSRRVSRELLLYPAVITYLLVKVTKWLVHQF